MTPREYLIAARARIEKPENWTQGFFARDANGETCMPGHPKACKFCLLGAMLNDAGPVPEQSEAGQLLYRALRALGHRSESLATFNDCHTHVEVLELFDVAIRLAE
jgi:hypothetical protein